MSNFKRISYQANLVKQGKNEFYNLTIPSNILADSCFVIRRKENNRDGFQRVLDSKRAEDIAQYIDNGGSIPSAVVLSAQDEAKIKFNAKKNEFSFDISEHAFMILDGQHRIFGFQKAKSRIFIPTIIYVGLGKKDEIRLFIDINTKQRPVPNELLLDIKKIAEYESENETILRATFDLFNSEKGSILLNLLSPHERDKEKISRVTFNTALKPILKVFNSYNANEMYEYLNAYLSAVAGILQNYNIEISYIVSPKIFKAFILFFKDAAQKVFDRNGKNYNIDNFYEVLNPILTKSRIVSIKNSPKNYTQLYESLSKSLRDNFNI